MGRVLAGASLAALLLTAAATVQECVQEMRHGVDRMVLVGQRERLARIRARLVELEAKRAGLRALTERAVRAGIALRVPGLPEYFYSGARVRPVPSPEPRRVRN